MLRLALIVNPGSGSGEGERAEAILRRTGALVETVPIEAAPDAGALGADRIVVAGGDGSIGAAAGAAASAGVPLAVLACGTANDFAGYAGLPTDLEEACDLAVSGSELRHLELAVVGGRNFVNVVSAGLAPAAAERAEGLKERLGPLAYPVGAVGAGASEEPIAVAVAADGRSIFEGEAWQVSVASGGAFGGGSTLLADGGDGFLDVVVVDSGSRARLVRVAYGLTLGTVEDQSGVIAERVGEVELELDPDAALNVDGELVPVAELTGADGVVRLSAQRPGFDLIVG